MYLLQKYGAQPQDFRYALSARNMDRLKKVHSEVGVRLTSPRPCNGPNHSTSLFITACDY